MAVRVERARRLFTIEEYERMVETGILTRDDRVELIEGEIVEMSPIGNPARVPRRRHSRRRHLRLTTARHGGLA